MFVFPLELVLIMLSVNPAFDEMTVAEEWITANLREEAFILPFSFKYDGRSSVDLIKTWKKEYSSEKLDENRIKNTITFVDSNTGLEVRAESIVYNRHYWK